MNSENLNIAYHVRRLVVKALNKFKTQKEAAKALGISARTLIKYKDDFDIERDSTGVYVSKARQRAMALLIIGIAHCSPQKTVYSKYQVRRWFHKIDECRYRHPYTGDTAVLASDGMFHVKK